MLALRCALLPALVLAAVLTASATASSLIVYSSCPRLLTFYHNNAVKRASEFSRFSRPFVKRSNQRVRRARSSRGPIQARAKSAPRESAAIAPETPVAGADFSDTNVQVEGVDEPDIVKTDGSRVLVVRNRKISLVRTAAAGMRGSVVSTLDLPTSLREMVIEKDTLLVIGSEYGELEPNARPKPTSPFIPRPRPVSIPRPRRASRSVPRRQPVTLSASVQRRKIALIRGQPITVVYKVSAYGDRLRLIETLRMQGSYLSAREVNGVVRIVTTYRPTYSFSYPVPIARGVRTPAGAALRIRRTTLDTWLPRYRVTGPYCDSPSCPNVRKGYLVGCGQVYHPRDVFSGFGLLTVTTLRMKSSLSPRSTAVVSNGRNVYSTASSLYVATTVYQNDFLSGPQLGASFSTAFHKFRLRGTDAVYAGSGVSPGSVLNQFSMHEYKGVFYVATTIGAPWWNRRDQSKSQVASFRQVGRTLKKIGVIGNLGLGERIFAVRYVEALAYVVTFRQIDPLYVLDIKNPANMRKTGELKIPGFSSYLHPIGNGRLLGVGRDATPDGRTTGSKVSLFDVSDVRNPREVAAWTLKGSSSSARWDHRAFLYWAPESLAVLPLSLYSSETKKYFYGSILLKITGNKIVEKGRISHPKCCGRYASQPSIERNFVLGRINLWSLSRQALQVNDIRTLKYKSIVNL